MPQGLELLTVNRINSIMEELVAETDAPDELTFLNRAARRDATSDEILGRFRGNVFISDIITEDAVAVIKGGETYSTSTNNIPKIKHGERINEETVRLLLNFERGAGVEWDRLTLRGKITDAISRILLGIRQRENQILAAMHMDEFNYSRGGMIMTGVDWGQPADLKFEPAIDWTTANLATMRPIDDLSTAIQYGKDTYGLTLNRATMSNTLLKLILNSTEFKDKAELFFIREFPAGTFPPTQATASRRRLFLAILNDGENDIEIVTEDYRYKDQLPDGSIHWHRYWPENKVLIDRRENDNNPRSYYLGADIVTETAVSALAGAVGGMQGAFSGPQRGPVSWTEVPSLNPPNINIWGADNAWPVNVTPEDKIIMTVA
jgi:hypothetical protein